MENASKALIIAGAILLAILIIGLGMTIFNQARDTLSQANLDQEVISAFNSKFDSYIGGKIKGTDVRTLLDLVRNNNLAADNNTIFGINLTVLGKSVVSGLKIDSKVDDIKKTAPSINTAKNDIVKGTYYKVEAGYASSGLIDTITVSAK